MGQQRMNMPIVRIVRLVCGHAVPKGMQNSIDGKRFYCVTCNADKYKKTKLTLHKTGEFSYKVTKS